MRVLFDENLPHDLISEFGGHEVVTVQGLGWAGVKNGDLFRRAAGQIDVFLTMDRKLEHEHDFADQGRRYGGHPSSVAEVTPRCVGSLCEGMPWHP